LLSDTAAAAINIDEGGQIGGDSFSIDVQDYQNLSEAAANDIIIVNYDAEKTSISENTEAIIKASNGEKVAEIDFVNHGSSGEFSLTEQQTVSLKTLNLDLILQQFWKDLGSGMQDGGCVDLLI